MIGNNKHYLGISLVEQLLVLAIAAVILVTAIQRFSLYGEQRQITNIKTDLSSIFNALNSYFRQQGCDNNSRFRGNTLPDLSKDLKLEKLINGRPPDLLKYTPEIVLFKAPSTKQPYYLYQFVINGDFSTTVNAEKKKQLLQATNGYLDSNQQSKWKMLPTQNYTRISDEWIIAARLRQFKQKFLPSATEHRDSQCAQ